MITDVLLKYCLLYVNSVCCMSIIVNAVICYFIISQADFGRFFLLSLVAAQGQALIGVEPIAERKHNLYDSQSHIHHNVIGIGIRTM